MTWILQALVVQGPQVIPPTKQSLEATENNRLVTEVTDVGRVGARHDRTNDYRWLLLTQWLGRHEA